MRIPLIETSAQRLTTVLGLDLKRTRSSLLDEPFSFSAGVQDGETNVTVLSIAQEFVDLRETRTLALRAAANFGLPIFNATENPSPAPDGGFVSFIGQGQVAQRLASGLTLVGRVQGQIATKPLLPVEQVAVGGRDTVRGYGESALIGDEAIVGSVEARIALFDGAAPGITPPGHDATVAIAPFVDAGGVFLKSGGSDLLVGAGAGLLWSPRPGVDVSLYAAAALTSRELRGGGAQGEGVHFAVSFGLP